MVIGAIFTGLFMFVAVPVMIFLIIWSVVTAMRICLPEELLPLDHDPALLRRIATARGEHVPVGLQEIREDQRRYVQGRLNYHEYYYVTGEVHGLPLEWLEDLHQRRN